MGVLIEEPRYRNRTSVYDDREDAGRQLASRLYKYAGRRAAVLAIPSGGVPVGAEIARVLGIPLDLAIVRKLQIPWQPEAGFGAVNSLGEVVLNERLVGEIGLGPETIEEAKERSMASIRAREQTFRKGRSPPPLSDRVAILVDDGLASGFTMLAAIDQVKREMPERIVVAVPTGSLETVDRILPEVDELVCLNVRGPGSFAVADAYRHWYDLTDEEVISILSVELQMGSLPMSLNSKDRL
jgi:putative phosphoribosyl transferase